MTYDLRQMFKRRETREERREMREDVRSKT